MTDDKKSVSMTTNGHTVIVADVSATYEALISVIDEEREVVRGLISMLERHPDLANKLAVVLKLAAERP